MRRLFMLLGLLLVSTGANGAEWTQYFNDRYGIAVDVPPDFEAGAPPENGDGMTYATPTARLAVFGAFVHAVDFEDEVRKRIGWDEEAGWGITYQVSTPRWASWSGQQGNRILYARAIAMCRGTQIGMFVLEYSVTDREDFDPVVARMVNSLRSDGGWQCPAQQ